MSGNMRTRLIATVLAILLSRRGLAQDFAPEFVSPLAMEAPYDGFVIDNSELTLKTFERLHVTFGGKPADGLDFALFDWTRCEWTLPTPTPGRYVVSLVVHSGDKRPGRFGYVVNGAEYVSEDFRLSGYQWGSRMAALLVRIPEGQAQTRMFVAGNGLHLRRVAFSRVTRPIRLQDGKIKELVRSSYRTLLRRRGEQPGKQACVVLVPERGPEADPARRLARRLGVAVRQEPELKNPFPAYPLTERVTPDTNLILLRAGRGGPLSRALRRAGTIGGSPTSRGVDNTWRIRTIARPFRGRANVIVISAGNPSALARACEVFASFSNETGQECVYERFLTFGPDSTDGGELAHVRDHRTPDDPWWRKQEDNLGEPLCGIRWSAPARGFLSCIGKYASAYWSTGSERYAELFKKYVFKMEEDRVYTSYGGGADAHMALSTLMRAWDRVEEASAFSDEDRLRVVNHLLWCLESDQGFPRSGGCHWYSGKVRMRHNHQTILGQGMMAAYLYFSRLYELGLPELWKGWCDDLIENATAWGHAPEDSALYEPGTFREVAAMIHYQGLSTKGIKGTELWPQTALRFLAAQDSFGFPAAYGDCWSSFQVTAMAFFQVMADDWGWPATQFVEDHRIRGFRYARPEDRIASEDHASRNGSTDVGGARTPGDPIAVGETLRPLLGLAVIPMGRGYYDYMTGAVGNEKPWQQHERPPAPPYEKTADKVQYRSGWSVQDEYLLVDALGWACHGQMDLGAIVHYCEGGRLWLVDSGYANKGPEHHSMLDLARDGKGAWRRRKNPGQLHWTGFMYEGQQMMEITECQPRTPGAPGPFRFALRTRDYAGATWERTVAGGVGKGLLIQDVVTAEQAGEYEAHFRLRFLGALDGEGDHWRVRQKGAELPVLLQTMEGDVVRSGLWQADKRAHQKGRYAGYVFVEDDGSPKTLVWTRKIKLNRGETTVFRATLGPSTGTGPAPQE